ncbi:hemicentin-1 isoform X5 [Strongylocentrotus purpuratus]|uniref:Uncharacterized protein n=1 Tax=Strongylocentrotus purpuratus TaxID=7668 RepID=A0A7M7ST29_STRPU|nr:hemicentin-1 isoform X5 [Strongylocentrotus purpuratus]
MNTFNPTCLLLCLANLTFAWYIGYNDVPPSIVEQPESINGDQRVPLTLTCRATGTPEPTYYWEKDGALFNVDSNDRVSLDGGNLVIKSLTTADDGQYQCFAKNRLGTAMSQKILTSLAFMDQFENTEPAWIQVRRGRPLKLLCGGSPGIPNGNPAPLIYWTNAAAKPTPITYNARIAQDPEGNLVFSHAIASDAQGYYCQAINNIVGSSQRTPIIRLSVTDLPAVKRRASLITKPAASEIAIRTQSLKLNCIAYGYPTPVITWKRGEEQLQSGGRVSIHEHELVISAVENSDEGTYTCVASNSGGDDEFSTVVTVESAPYFPYPPSDESKRPGESVDIECRSEGVPAPTVDWFVNGQPWADFESNRDTERWEVVTGDPQLATISITNLQTTDSNVFQCIATNMYKEELTSVVLNVFYLPSASRLDSHPAASEVAIRTQSFKLKCIAFGYPTPVITWKRGEEQLQSGGRVSIQEFGQELVIFAFEISDEGTYTCVASNTGGDDEFSTVVTVEYDVPPSIVEQPESINGDERIPLTLTCRATGTPEPTYYWEKDGALFNVDSNDRVSLDGGNLVIESLTTADDGQYQCFAKNRLGTAMSQKILTSLAFMDQFENIEPARIQVSQGQPLKLRCGGSPGVPNGTPAPLIYWTDATPKPTPITYNARINQDPQGNLVFSNVIASDAKGYYCQAINNVVGSSQRSPKVTLRVRDRPAVESGASLVTKPAATKIAIRTQLLKLKCIAYGYPTPVITWKRGEEQLQSGGRVSIEESGQELVISAVENSDKGTYTCVASNTGGDDEFSTVVTVESAPYFPSPPSDESKRPGESVDIECRSEGVPAPTVDWFVNGQPWADFESNRDTERWRVVTGDPQLASISITNLQTTDSSVFQCIATNMYKEELTSVVLNVISIPASIPSFTPLTRKLSVVQNDSAKFTCHDEGIPTPTITWTFKGSVLTNRDKYTINETEGSLMINNVKKVDSGEYECTAENSIDGQDHEATGSATLIVLGTLLDDFPPSIVEQPESVTGDQRIPLTLPCRAIGTPEPTYYWEKDGSLFDVDSNDRTRLDGGNLVIESLTTADDGQYQCFANNRLGTAMSQKIRTSLAFMEQFVNTAPAMVQMSQGQPLKLRCGGSPGVPNGNPAPLIYWTDAAPKPTPIGYDARINQDLEGNLVFSNVIASDAKGYYCLAINNVGSFQRSPKITLSVTDLPAVASAAHLDSHPAASEVANRTQSFKLKCIAFGYPTPVITWKRGEEQLQSGGRVSIEESGQALVISAVENSDEGTYTCVASNTGGDDEFSTVVTVESAPYFPAPPFDETKGPGESFDIECRSEGVPPPTVEWLVNGQPWADFESNIDTERWTVVTGDPQLATIAITNLQTTDSNVFQCIATNKYKEELTSVVLNVVYFPARITSYTPLTRRLSVVEDDSAKFICHFKGRPTPTITWTFKGSVLTNGIKYTLNETEGSVVINNVKKVDSGEYECRAENAIDGEDYEATGSATLTVLGKTTIYLSPANLMIREGNTATFQCEIMYDEELIEPYVYWMKDGQRLEANQGNSLRIANAHFTHSGTYTCVLEATIDESAATVHSVNASAQLIVKGRPESPQILMLRAKQQEFAMDLFWEPGNDNNAPIQYYIVQYDTKWADMHWQFQANETASGLAIYRKVLYLQPFVDYRFRVIAVNEIGESEPSAEVAPTDDPQVAPPSKNPSGVSGSSTRPESMVIRWQAIHPFYYGGDDFHYEVAYRPRLSSEPFTKATVDPENTDDNPTGIIQNYIVDARKPCEEFEFSVRSMNSGGPGPEPEIHYGFSGEASHPDPPQYLQLRAKQQEFAIDLFWEPGNDNNAPIQYYIIQYDTKWADLHWQFQANETASDVSTYRKVLHLQPFVDYRFRVIAVNEFGESEPSAEVAPTVDPEVAPPSINPSGVNGNSTPESMVIRWQAIHPFYYGGDDFHYEVAYRPRLSSEPFIKDTVYPENTDDNPTGIIQNYIVDARKPYEEFEFSVRSMNSGGPGPEPEIHYGFSGEGPHPDPPQNLQLRAKEQQFAMDLFWEPGNDNNAPIQYYIIQYDTKWADMHWQFQANETASDVPTYRKVLYLQPFVDYRFRVIAVNEFGESEPSAEVAPTVDPEVAPPSINPSGVNGSSTRPESMVIRWQAIHPFYYSGDGFHYEVAYRPRLSSEPFTKATVYPENTDDNPTGIIQNYIVDASKPCEEFEFSVRSMNSGGPGPEPEIHYGFSGEASHPGPPQNVQLRAKEQEFAMDLFWEAGNDNDAPIQYYIIQYNTKWTDMHWQFQANETSGGFAIYRKVLYLQPFVEYQFRVIAVNEIGESKPSAEVAPTVDPQVAPPSINPSGVNGSSTPESTIIRWQAIHPFYYGGDDFHYEVAYRPRLSSEPFTKATVDPENTDDNPTGIIQNYIVDASKPCEEFEFSVRSMNSGGPGPEPEVHYGFPGVACLAYPSLPRPGHQPSL